MATIKLELDGMSDDDFKNLVNLIYSKINGNPDYTTIAPLPAAFLAQKDAFIDKLDERAQTEQLLRSQTTEKNDLRAVAAASLKDWARAVQTKTGGDKSAIELLGFQTVAPRQPSDMSQVLELSLTEGDNQGEIDAQWKPVHRAKSYEIEIATDPNDPTSWKKFDVSAKSKFTLSGLMSGERIWVRVRAVGANNKGGWSDPAMKIVP